MLGPASNCLHMLRLAVGFCPSVPALCLLQATLAALFHLIGLFAALALIDCLEKGRPLGILLAWIGGLTLGRVLVGALAAYVRENKLYGRVWVRSELVRQIHNKFAQTSYPNVNDPAFLKLQDKASMAVCGNDEAGEAIWATMEGLIQSAAELAVYAAMLTAVDRWVLVLTLASAALCYVFGKRMNSWGYWHRQEESVYSREMNYVNQKAADAALAKDVRIFDMRPCGWFRHTRQLLIVIRAFMHALRASISGQMY